MLESATTNDTNFTHSSNPPVGDAARLIVTAIPLAVTGPHFRAVRLAARLSQEKFAQMIGITMVTLRFIEKSEKPLIVRCHTETLLRIVRALAQLGVRFKQDGSWETIKGGSG
jgi:DNA-binding XRE family transcriptional regulator